MTSEHAPIDRTKVTFEQAEGLAPLPQQLKAREISSELRAIMWAYIFGELEGHKNTRHRPYHFTTGPWSTILEDFHVLRLYKNVDEFSAKISDVYPFIKSIMTQSNYGMFFGFLQFVIRHNDCPDDLANAVNEILIKSRSAYRVVEKTIVPIGSDEELSAVIGAFADVHAQKFKGARSHLRQAAEGLSEGRFADSVRDSIHAVEATARVITTKSKLSDALTELEKSAKMHGSMKAGFDRLYGWTSDEKGIRHPLLNEGDANVSEADALFMLGACASFVSLLIAKGRAAGLVEA
ncbi:hypothetical protein SAMN04487843_101108 [Methylobacterium sp. ap11]|uniref:AbiJ-NTD4 domain-containing protein n=1 Tax=Methylobacterium sp. ap11 TaxID=1761799 RepID=UPI0008B559D6|nr:hypothetical protein [Methylobacterium sp. ap11]SEO35534.1 hypothetical protein SAMN04487843_101108 [Methylobacterium sp. ap11]